MPLFNSILPLYSTWKRPAWEGNLLKFSIFAEKAEIVEYCFYANPLQLVYHQPCNLIEKVTLQKNIHKQGEIWSWVGQLHEDTPKYDHLGVLIRVWKTKPHSTQLDYRWVLDPFCLESTGGEDWAQPTGFQIQAENLNLHKIPLQTIVHKDQVLRIPVLRRTEVPYERPVKPAIPFEKTIIYEVHLRGLTQSPTAALQNPQTAGTFAALVEKIPYFKKLGITTIELLPIHDFNENENPNISPVSKQRLLNYWGYSTIFFFAPKQAYFYDKHNVTEELKKVIDELHRHNLEIVLDVVYNHTAEQGENSAEFNFKWLSREAFYLNDFNQQYANYSGCGNTFHCAHPAAKQLIIESLHYWANEIGVDGFRFDLTTILDRRTDGAINHFPHLLWEIKNTPSLAGVKWIAEPWDAGGGYQLGHLAYHVGWAEWNDHYRNAVRRVARGDHGVIPELLGALSGSPNVYMKTRRTQSSINFITAHDGFTLWDLVSYNSKHNESNGEMNRDGAGENHSYNCGVEGATEDPTILALRWDKIRALLTVLMVSKGVPMLLGGDESCRTQLGNNNAYCLDSPLNWLDWSDKNEKSQMVDFVSRLIHLRLDHLDLLNHEHTVVSWHNFKGKDADLTYHSRTLACHLISAVDSARHFYLIFNFFEEDMEFLLPPTTSWTLLLDSAVNQDDVNPTINTNMNTTIKSSINSAKTHSKATVEAFSVHIYKNF